MNDGSGFKRLSFKNFGISGFLLLDQTVFYALRAMDAKADH